MREGSQDAVRRARGIADRPYQAYGGERIAQLSDNERRGIAMAGSNVGAWEGDFASARAQLESIGSITDEGALDGYFNPYMDRVVSPQLRRRNEAFERERSRRRATAGMRGAFGGRQQLADTRFQEGFEREQDDFMGQAYGRAFDVATSLYSQEMDRKLATAGAFQQLGEGAQRQRRQDLDNLMRTGMIDRTREQADRDFQYLEFLEERDWDVQNLSTLVQTLSSVPYETSTTGRQTTTEEVSQSPLKTLAGVGAIIGGTILSGGTFGAALLGAGQAALGTPMTPPASE